MAHFFLFDALGSSSKYSIASRLLWYMHAQSLLIQFRDFTGRHRWVEYAEKGRYNASQVPPEWHGWLHYITDRTGDEASPASILFDDLCCETCCM